jgi:hypothetical protein
LCGTTFNTNTCACSAFPTHPCGLTFNTATCSFNIPSCPLSCQTYDQAKCSCTDPTCLNGQQFFTYTADNFCTCYYVIEKCRTYTRNTDPTTLVNFPIKCSICEFTYVPSSTGFNCDYVPRWFVSSYTGNGQAAGSTAGLAWNGYWVYQSGATATTLGSFFLSLREDIETFYSTLSYGFQWQINYYAAYGFYSIHTFFIDNAGRTLMPPFYFSTLNNQLQIVVGFTQNQTVINTQGNNIPTNDLFFLFSNGNYIDATHTLWSISDRTGTFYISPQFTFTTNFASRATMGFGSSSGHY